MRDVSICFILISPFVQNSAFITQSVIYDFLFEIYIWNENKLKPKIFI